MSGGDLAAADAGEPFAMIRVLQAQLQAALARATEAELLLAQYRVALDVGQKAELAAAEARLEESERHLTMCIRAHYQTEARLEAAVKALEAIATDLTQDPGYAQMARDFAETTAREALAALAGTHPGEQDACAWCKQSRAEHGEGQHWIGHVFQEHRASDEQAEPEIGDDDRTPEEQEADLIGEGITWQGEQAQAQA